MKYFFLFILALILCAAMALSSVLPGITAYNNGKMERVADNTPSTNRYSVSGSRNGIVTVKDAVSSEVIRTFKMDDGVVVRETFLLDGGKTVAASQKDHAVFWELATGKEVRRFPQRIYGFSHDETKFFTYKFPQGIIFVHSYPSFTLACKWKKGAPGPVQFRFSPNDRFLNIQFGNGYPPIDENYPLPDRSGGPVSYARLFEIETCQEIKEFYQLNLLSIGEFSADSNFLVTPEYTVVDLKSRLIVRTLWRFNLKTYKVEKLAD
ncbi:MULTISPECIES: hypothetical protein [unclassified Microcoleus]|uniref:hypothetical protein n=1 Tax=unclassified Microcoleus TaxID=2642155 RepID=UPI002FD5F4F9